MIIGLFEIELVSRERRWNHAFIFSVFEENNIMRLNFDFLLKIFIGAVKDEFPVAFTLIFIYYRDSLLNWLLDKWSFFYISLFNTACLCLGHFILLIKWNRLIILREVHVAIGSFVINQQSIVVINWVPLMFIASMRFYLKYCMRWNCAAHFYFEGSVSTVSCFHDAS